MPTDRKRHQSFCCPEVVGPTRREFLRSSGSVFLLAVLGASATACVMQPGGLPRVAGLWSSLGDAPFTRHAHSAAATGGRLLVMGDRRGVSIEESGPADSQAEITLHFVGREFKYEISGAVDIPSGTPVRIVFTNEGLVDHDLTFAQAGIYLRAAPGKTSETIAVFNEPEAYFCSIGGHAEAGMVGDLRVDGKAPAEGRLERDSGTTEMWWYDPAENSWHEAPLLPHSYDHVTMVAVGGDVYSIGGFTGDIGSSRADVFVLRSSAAEWERRSDLPVSRGAMAGASDGERIFVTGGRSDAEGTPSSVDLFTYLPAEDRWLTLETRLPTGRDHVAGAVVDGVFWVVGGRGDGRRVSSTPVMEGFVIDSGKWIPGVDVPVPGSASGVAALDSQVLVFGGEGPSATPSGAAGRSFVVYRETLLYDPRSDVWRKGPNIPLAVHHPAYDVVNGILYSVGGGPVSGVSATASVQSFRLAL